MAAVGDEEMAGWLCSHLLAADLALEELLDLVEVDAVDVSLENAAVEEDVVALETTARACEVVRGGVATFPPAPLPSRRFGTMRTP